MLFWAWIVLGVVIVKLILFFVCLCVDMYLDEQYTPTSAMEGEMAAWAICAPIIRMIYLGAWYTVNVWYHKYRLEKEREG